MTADKHKNTQQVKIIENVSLVNQFRIYRNININDVNVSIQQVLVSIICLTFCFMWF